MKLKKKNSVDHDHDKYITTQEFNKLASEIFSARLAQANLARENDITNFIKKTDFEQKLKKIKQKLYFKENKTCTC